MTLRPMNWCQRLNLQGKINHKHAEEIDEILDGALDDAIEMSHEGWVEEGRQQKRLKTIQEMQNALPDYIDGEYPKGSADRGHATVHIVKFLLDYRDKNV